MAMLYTFLIYLFKGIYFGVLPFFNQKAKMAKKGRRGQQTRIQEFLENNKDPVLWMHCASLGEFEQGLPLLERIKTKYPNHAIAVSFFSPSGYEKRKNHPIIDLALYLPIDTPGEMQNLVNQLNPALFILVKYEFWFNLLRALQKAQTPAILVSGIFRKQQIFFKPYGDWFKKQLTAFHAFFVQNQESKELLKKLGYTNVFVSGDTRIQRVINQTVMNNDLPFVQQFKAESKLFVAGSTWPIIHPNLMELIRNTEQLHDWKFLIAPHEMHEKEIKNLTEGIPQSIRYSEISDLSELTAKRVLILDTVGYLSRVYAYADLAYVGGAFGSGLHNVLEAAVFGAPVIFGNKTSKFPEAQGLIKNGGGIQLSRPLDIGEQTMELIQNESLRLNRGAAAKQYVFEQPNAVDIIVDSIQKTLNND